MLETILAISGKPGLYKLVSRGNRSLIVESIDDKHRRMPAFGTDKVISLADIAMYTDEEEVPLADVLEAMKTKENGAQCSIDVKKVGNDELFAYFEEILHNYDRDRVYPSDVRKLIMWYNILIGAGLDDFSKMAPTEGDNIDNRKEQAEA
jgi:dephospho-CoA kinase